MATIRTRLAAVAVLGLALAGCSDDGGSGNQKSISAEDSVFNVTLEGEAEAPGPGDDTATGLAEVTVDPDGTEVCYTLSVNDLTGVTGAHIHEGREGIAGPIAVTLKVPERGQSQGCVTTSSSIVKGITSGSRSFYINVHTSDFPDGAIRAQLT